MEQQLREIQENEIRLVNFLLKNNNLKPSNYKMSSFVFNTNTQDNIGGFRFFYENFDHSGFLNELSHYQYNDLDGTPVIITLYENEGYLMELDIWKVNFLPVLSLPSKRRAG